MADSDDGLTPRQNLGLVVFFVGNVFAAHELAGPGWGFDLGLPVWVLYAIGVGCGLVGGGIYVERSPVVGAACGALSGLGALLAVATFLSGTTETNTAVLALIALLGASPGLAIWGLFVYTRKTPEETAPEELPPPAD